MIDITVILSAVDRHWPDFVIILLLLMINAAVEFWEEHQEGNAIAVLKAKKEKSRQRARFGKMNPHE